MSRSLLYYHNGFLVLNLPHNGIKWKGSGHIMIPTQFNKVTHNLNQGKLNLVAK